MNKYIIETLTLNDNYFDENDIAQDYTRNEYLVKRASDGYPVAQFQYYWQAEQFIKDLAEED